MNIQTLFLPDHSIETVERVVKEQNYTSHTSGKIRKSAIFEHVTESLQRQDLKQVVFSWRDCSTWFSAFQAKILRSVIKTSLNKEKIRRLPGLLAEIEYRKESKRENDTYILSEISNNSFYQVYKPNELRLFLHSEVPSYQYAKVKEWKDIKALARNTIYKNQDFTIENTRREIYGDMSLEKLQNFSLKISQNNFQALNKKELAALHKLFFMTGNIGKEELDLRLSLLPGRESTPLFLALQNGVAEKAWREVFRSQVREHFALNIENQLFFKDSRKTQNPFAKAIRENVSANLGKQQKVYKDSRRHTNFHIRVFHERDYLVENGNGDHLWECLSIYSDGKRKIIETILEIGMFELLGGVGLVGSLMQHDPTFYYLTENTGTTVIVDITENNVRLKCFTNMCRGNSAPQEVVGKFYIQASFDLHTHKLEPFAKGPHLEDFRMVWNDEVDPTFPRFTSNQTLQQLKERMDISNQNVDEMSLLHDIPL